MNNKKGGTNTSFQHTGKAFIPSSSIKPSKPSNFDIVGAINGLYGFLNFFAIAFVQFPHQYIIKMRELLLDQLTIMYDFYKKMMQKSNEIVQTYMKKFNIIGSIKVIFKKPELNYYKGKK